MTDANIPRSNAKQPQSGNAQQLNLATAFGREERERKKEWPLQYLADGALDHRVVVVQRLSARKSRMEQDL
jgi:hypothetical protein